ncbi:MAG: hypothetical protein AAF639_23095 [Chloroflexota bacterium]
MLINVGILNACTPQDEQDFKAKEIDSFQRLLASPNIKLVEYRITEGAFPASPNECDAYVITGSPKGVYDDDAWIVTLSDFIQACYHSQIKLVGICFGHQILAHALGGHAEKSTKGWGLGLSDLMIHTNDIEQLAWMEPPLPTGSFYFCHQDQVTQLPDGASHLGGSAFCPNGLFVMGHQVLATQAHPEFTHEIMAEAFAWLRPHLDGAFMDAAEANLNTGQPDNAVMAQWIVNFLLTKSECSDLREVT